MKPHLSFLFLLLSTLFAHGQNLVPNPSFEDTLECPDFPGQIWRASGWYVVRETPDYFHSCCNTTHPVCGVPNNVFGTRSAVTGMAYCGVLTYDSYIFAHEYLGIQLSEKLIIGIRYYVTFMLSSSSSRNQGVNGASDKTGILFSTNKFDLSNIPPTNNHCQVWADSIITDTIGWQIVKGSFIADSAYEYITLGNFFTDSATNTILYWVINGNYRGAYNYIDDVCVSTDSFGCDFSSFIYAPQEENPFVVFPNPVTNEINIKSKYIPACVVQLFNIDGKSIFRREYLQQDEVIKINTIDFLNGFYFLQINSNENFYSQKISITKN